MGIVYQEDKRVGITYAYESEARWDREKKQSRAKRKLIGRVDPATGEIVPTDGRHRKAAAGGGEKKEDYRKLYEGMRRRCGKLEAMASALQKEIRELRGRQGK